MVYPFPLNIVHDLLVSGSPADHLLADLPGFQEKDGQPPIFRAALCKPVCALGSFLCFLGQLTALVFCRLCLNFLSPAFSDNQISHQLVDLSLFAFFKRAIFLQVFPDKARNSMDKADPFQL